MAKQKRQAVAMLSVVALALTVALAFAFGAAPGQPAQPSGSEPSGTNGTAREQLTLDREKLELDRQRLASEEKRDAQRLAREEKRDRYTFWVAVGAAITVLTGFLTFLANQNARLRERFRGDVDALTSLKDDVDPARRVAAALSLPSYYRTRSWLPLWSRAFATEVVNLVAVCLKLRGAESKTSGGPEAPDQSLQSGSSGPTQGGAAQSEHDAAQARQRVFYDALATTVVYIGLRGREGLLTLMGDLLRRITGWRGLPGPFAQVDMGGAHLSDLHLSGANFALAYLRDANLIRAKLNDANLSTADLRYANLSGADLSYANLFGANLSYANLWGANLTEAYLSQADLVGTDLRGAVLRDADLSGADLHDANLSGAVLWGADLTNATLRDADLTNATLRGADLTNATLRGADLRGADLTNATLRGADLRGADLTNATLRGADLAHAALSEETTLPDASEWRPGADVTQFAKPDSALSGTDCERGSPTTD